MALMNLPNPPRSGRLGRQVLMQTATIEPIQGHDYVIDWIGKKFGGITGELMACTYLKSSDGSHFFSYLGESTWGGITMIVSVTDEALLRGEVAIYEMVD